MTVSGLLGLVMASSGIYGVISYSVSRRTREIGVRLASGARPADIVRLIVWQGGFLTTAGIATGALLALALTRLIAVLLGDISSMDPITFVAVILVLGGTALTASYIRARRAGKVDPMVALRYE